MTRRHRRLHSMMSCGGCVANDSWSALMSSSGVRRRGLEILDGDILPVLSSCIFASLLFVDTWDSELYSEELDEVVVADSVPTIWGELEESPSVWARL